MKLALGLLCAAALAAACWVVRPAGPCDDPVALRELAIASGLYHQSWLRPGCGNEREEEDEAIRRLDRSLLSTPALIPGLLADRDPKVRAAAILTVGHYRVRGYESRLCDILLTDPDPFIRECSAAALGRTRSTACELKLRNALDDKCLDVAIMAGAALMVSGKSLDKQIRTRLAARSYKAGKSGYMSWVSTLQ